GGQWGDMGPSAVMQAGSVQILITSKATYEWADEQFRSMDLEAHTAKFVIVKNPMNYRLGYGSIFKDAFILDTPGPTPATVRRLAYKSMRRPYFPADNEIPGCSPRVI